MFKKILYLHRYLDFMNTEWFNYRENETNKQLGFRFEVRSVEKYSLVHEWDVKSKPSVELCRIILIYFRNYIKKI